MTWFTRVVSLLLISHMSCASSKKDSDALFAKWAAITQPSAGPTTPVGAYAAGCLSGGVKVPADGAGYAVMRLSRNHYYAHPDMGNYLQGLSERLRSEK